MVRSNPSLCSTILHVMPKDTVQCHPHPASEEALEEQNKLVALDRQAILCGRCKFRHQMGVGEVWRGKQAIAHFC